MIDDQFATLINEALLADRFRLRQRLRRLPPAHSAGAEAARRQLSDEIAASRQRRLDRAARIPPVTFAHDLPIHERLTELQEAIERNQVVIVCGETGSGKSTQLPKLCLAMGRGIEGLIGHTQPRRIAARSIADRLAQELGTTVGGSVGFKVRFTDTTQPNTYIKLMTDGILLAETQQDRFLEQYDTLIIDEAHERSLNIDFLLGFLKRLLPRRPDIRVIVTSATIDVARFSDYFASDTGPAPVIEVSGRTYPVEIRYRPPEPDADGNEPNLMESVVAGIDECLQAGRGDVLVFLPTERDIRDAAKTLRGAFQKRGPLDILPLYARLPTAEQQRVFQSHAQRRIVLATNVAESSLTVPDIHYVVDTGLARLSRYSPRSKVQRLPIEPISRASADQRSGRCGRIAPGVCIRLYSEEDYATRDQYTTPEVRRTNLASVILQTLALRLGTVEQFPFLDPPAPDKIRDGYATLFELGAIDEHRELTALGKQLARLPVDPRIGRMVLAAQQEHCLSEVLIIAAALESQDPRERPPDRQAAADEAHARYADERSDFQSYLKLWDFYHHLREELSRSQLQRACRQNFLSLVRLREWADIYRQLLQLVDQLGIRRTARRDDYDAIHRALLTGLLSGVALRGDGSEYTGSGGNKFVLWPGSHLFASRPQWVMAGELVETSRRYLRTVARINPEWIEPVAQHLVKRSYSDPHWSTKRGEAMVHERVTLFGLPIVARRPTRLAPVDPEHAHELFLRHALVAGEASLKGSFVAHNQAIREYVEGLAAKTRRRDMLLDEEDYYRFYADRVPAEIADLASFDRWRREIEKADPKRLHMQVDDLLEESKAQKIAPRDYPEQLAIDRTALPLEYRFEPGDARDGVTTTIPLDVLPGLQAEQLDWLVPGLLEEKVLALIRTLPKQARRNFVPAPDAARRIARQLSFGEGAFLPALATALSKDAGERITPDMFRIDELPAYLRMNVRVVDNQGRELAAGRGLDEVRKQLGIEASPSLAHVADSPWKRAGLRGWQWEVLPEHVELQRGSLKLRAYPTIVDQGDSVALDLYASREAAVQTTWNGLRRLALLEHHRAVIEQVNWLPNLDKIQLFGAPLASAGQSLRDDLALLVCGRAYDAGGVLPRSADEYRRWLKTGKGRIPLAAQDVAKLAHPLFEHYHHVRLALEKAPAAWRPAIDDMRSQLANLVPRGFLTTAPWEWLEHYPRYLQAMRVRLEKLRGGLPRDQQHQQQVREFWERWQSAAEEDPLAAPLNPHLVMFRWMIEELRVSLFAQQLGVAMPVSAKRLERQWELVKQPQ